MQLCELIALCHHKNELNRKRRRWYYWAHNLGTIGGSPYTKEYAYSQYEATKKEMKDLTFLMYKVRKELGVKFKWSDHGAISYVITCDGRTIDKREFASYEQDLAIDRIIFGR